MFRKKFKKFFAVFSVIICLVSVNLSLFTVGASANMVTAGNNSYRTLGAPVSLNYYCFRDGEPYVGILNRPNVYLYKAGSVLPWYESPHYDNYELEWNYSPINTGSADLFLGTRGYSNISSIVLEDPILFTDRTDLDSYFNFNFGIYNPVNALNESLSSFVVYYTFTFTNMTLSGTGDPVFYDKVYEGSITINPSYTGSDYLAVVPFLTDSIITDNVIAANRNFVSTGDLTIAERFCYLKSAQVDFLGVYSNYYYFNPLVDGANQLYNDYTARQFSRFSEIYSSESYEEHIVFEDLSWTDWIINALGGFMDFEIVPGLSFAGMLGLLVGMSLFVIFLKVFAGG